MFAIVLGSGQDGGVPHVACYCPNCTYARENPTAVRRGPSLGFCDEESGTTYFIDASPDFSRQIDMLRAAAGGDIQGTRYLPDGIFLTHGHFGHYWGLGYLGKEACAPQQLPVYCTAEMAGYLRLNRPLSDLVQRGNIALKELTTGLPVRLSPRLSFTPLAVPHRHDATDTVGFWVEGERKRLLYIPDMDDYTEAILAAVAAADIALLDGCFYATEELPHRDIKEIPHPFIPYSMERLQHLAKDTAIYFTHFNHSNYLLRTDGAMRAELADRGFGMVSDGDRFIL
ncbi:MAG: MBL fold metallo-hydrolase [bacterium]